MGSARQPETGAFSRVCTTAPPGSSPMFRGRPQHREPWTTPRPISEKFSGDHSARNIIGHGQVETLADRLMKGRGGGIETKGADKRIK